MRHLLNMILKEIFNTITRAQESIQQGIGLFESGGKYYKNNR